MKQNGNGTITPAAAIFLIISSNVSFGKGGIVVPNTIAITQEPKLYLIFSRQ